jgi:hypothetical protein
MGKALFAACTFLALCIFGLALVSYLGRAHVAMAVDNLLAEQITRRIATSERVDLATVATFPFDQVLIVAPGTSNGEISDVVGSDFTGEMSYTAESNGMFVFVRAGAVVRYADYRGRGRFVGFRRPVDVLQADHAVLRVRGLRISRG